MLTAIDSKNLSITLKSPDAIMRPDIEDLIALYRNDNGDLNLLVNMLFQGYKGYPNLIDELVPIIEKCGVDATSIMEEHFKDSVVKMFKADEMDRLFIKYRNPPPWINIFIRPFWIPTILRLAQNHPNSLFLSHILGKICIENPAAITFLPPGLIPFHSFNHVFNKYVEIAQNDPKEIDKFISIAFTDDLTISFTAFRAHPTLSLNIESRLNKVPESQKRLFTRLLLRMENCDDKMIRTLTSNDKLTVEGINSFEEKISGASEYLKYLITEKLRKILLASDSNDDITSAAIKCLSKFAEEKCDPDYMIEAIKYVRKNRYRDPNPISLIAHSVHALFFASAILDDIFAHLSKAERTDDKKVQNNPQVIVLCEIAYYHQSLRKNILDGVFKILRTRNDMVNLEFYILEYLIKIGYGVEVINMLAKFSKGSAFKYEKRTLMNNILGSILPPYTPRFLATIADFILEPSVNEHLLPDIPSKVLNAHKDFSRFFMTFYDHLRRSLDPSRNLGPEYTPDNEILARLSRISEDAQRILEQNILKR